MSCTYFNVRGYEDHADKLEVVNDFYSGNALKHFKRQFVDDKVVVERLVDWDKRYRSSNYADLAVKEYLDYVQVLDEDNLNQRLEGEHKEVIDSFFEKNLWQNLYTRIAKSRKLYGDVYLYWYFDEDDIMRFKMLDARYVSIKTDQNQDIIAYVFEDDETYSEKNSMGDYQKKTIKVKISIDSEGVVIYHDGIKEEEIRNRVEVDGEIPIVHLQFSKQDDSPYSEIPAASIIDLCLDLDRIETNISHINHSSGAPRLIVIDGKLDVNTSGSGASTVLYVDTLRKNLRQKKQAKVMQLEITNALESSYKEREEKIKLLFRKFNLLPPDLQATLAKTDSSKVVSRIRKDLSNEIERFFKELIKKMKIPLNLQLKVKNLELEKPLSFEMPETIIDATVEEKLTIAAQKRALQIETLEEYLRGEGYTEQEIEEHKKELNAAMNLNPEKTNKQEIENDIEEVPKIKSVDNRMKTGVSDIENQ